MKCPICNKRLTSPRTLSCLHTFCLACLETQTNQTTQTNSSTSSSSLRCHQCKAPFTSSALEGVDAFACNIFIDSLIKSSKVNEGDVNSVIKCDLCEDEDAVMHCVECNQHVCPTCSRGHKRIPATAGHQQIPLRRPCLEIQQSRGFPAAKST